VLLVFLVFWRWGRYIGSDQQGDNSFTASLGLEDNNGTPMLVHTPVMNAEDQLALYKNQVAVPKGATNSLCKLFEFVARNAIVYQDPQKIGIGGRTGPTDHSYVTKIRYFGTYIRYLPTNPMSLQL